MKPLGILSVAGSTAFLAACLAWSGGAVLCAAPGSYRPGSASIENDGTLRIVGGIDQQLAGLVRDTLAQAQHPVTRVTLNSYGGQTRAMQEIAAMLGTTGALVEVPAGATCQSACVGLLANAPGPVMVAPTATLMFHAERLRFGLASQGPCGWMNVTAVWISKALAKVGALFAMLQGQKVTPVMQPWAQQLSPGLPKLFALCPTDPLETDRGIVLTGADLDGLRKGNASPEALVDRCPR